MGERHELTADDIRREIRSFLTAQWDPELSLREWRERLVDAGWACPTWPVEWHGRGLSAAGAAVVTSELATASAPGTPAGVGIGLAAPTILEHGSDDLKRRLLRPIATGADRWCQLFSEPGYGSDLAGLVTRADRDGDEWVVNGQKLWNTSAHHAEYGLLVARSDWDAPKHRGLTFFAIDMRQPGVEVRPVRQMNGHASFNEVFLTDARVPAADIIGVPGEGWRVALTTLAHERRLDRRPARTALDPAAGRAMREAQVETDELMAPYVWYPQRAGRAELAAGLAAALGRNRDPVVRQALARLESIVRTAEWTSRRAQAARGLGRPPGAEGSLGKLHGSVIAKTSADVHALVAGARAMLDGPTSLLDGVIAEVLVSVPAVSIAGGTDEIQRNIIGERILGLPKEPQVDRDIPYREVRRNASTPPIS
jgi:alkylation response protein AidB-like acyl-CoA dehydrogenase